MEREVRGHYIKNQSCNEGFRGDTGGGGERELEIKDGGRRRKRRGVVTMCRSWM